VSFRERESDLEANEEERSKEKRKERRFLSHRVREKMHDPQIIDNVDISAYTTPERVGES